MKSAWYAMVVLIAGPLALGILGVAQLRAGDPWGGVVFGCAVAILLLILLWALMLGRRAKVRDRGSAAGEQPEQTFRTTVVAEYPYPASAVWNLIRPAEAALELGGDDVVAACKVEGTPDGPGEQQRFEYRNGQILVIEILREIPGRSAVTHVIFPLSSVSTQTTYLIDQTAEGCRLSVETVMKAPFEIALRSIEEHGRSFTAKTREVLDRRASAAEAPEAPASPSM